MRACPAWAPAPPPPLFLQVLSDMQEDPAAAQKHLANPMIAKKVEKLVGAGIIQIR